MLHRQSNLVTDIYIFNTLSMKTCIAGKGGIARASTSARSIRTVEANGSRRRQQLRWQFRWWPDSDSAIPDSSIYPGNCPATMCICIYRWFYVSKSSVRSLYVCGAGNRQAVPMLMQSSLWCWWWFWAPQMSPKEEGTNTNGFSKGWWLLSSVWFRTVWIRIIRCDPLLALRIHV